MTRCALEFERWIGLSITFHSFEKCDITYNSPWKNAFYLILLYIFVHTFQFRSKEIFSLHLFALLLLLLRPVSIVFRSGIEDVEESFARIAHFEHARHVTTPVAVIGRAPDRTQSIVIQDLIPFLTELMRPQDMRHRIDSQKLLHDLRTKRIPSATRRERKLVALRIRIRPDEIRHRTLVRNFAESVNDLDLVDRVDRRRQATVHAEDLVVDDDRERQEVEHVGEVVPDVGIAVLA